MVRRSFIQFLWIIALNAVSLTCVLFFPNVIGLTWFVFHMILSVVALVWFWQYIGVWIRHLKKNDLMKTHL